MIHRGKKYLDVAQRIWKLKNRFFVCIFTTLTPNFISFLDTQWAYKIKTKNIDI